MSKVLCAGCGEPIRRRADFSIGGRVLKPMHNRCYRLHSEQLPWLRKPGWPINRLFSWVAFNALLLAVLLVGATIAGGVPDQRIFGEPLIILACFNAWLLVGRLLSYWSYERHIPH
ncbi:hypothetical protein WG922_20245 [Ramlibacter sp. AN1015]|uniref:hypothetical protein n=1 Tax=Ramlibacter sp. AN1015 TaxID=3133428 RepID=UPI0030BDC910